MSVRDIAGLLQDAFGMLSLTSHGWQSALHLWQSCVIMQCHGHMTGFEQLSHPV